MVSRAQITRSRAAWNACEAIRADDQIGWILPETGDQRRSPNVGR
jgi:hypothetical protein